MGDGRSQYGEGNAGHIGNLAGRIRIEEMNAALANAVPDQRYINHALTVAVRCTSGMSVSPAGSNVGMNCGPGPNGLSLPAGDANAPPMGAHLHLNMSLPAITALPSTVPEWKKVLLRTLANYGAYIDDTGSNPYFTWQTESGLQYTAMGIADPWLSFGAARFAETGSDWYRCEDSPDQWCPAGYKGLWNAPDGINWDAQVWSNLRFLAPP